MQERLDDFERRIRYVEQDWTEVYNKFRTLQMRVAKQVQRLDANSSQEEQRGEGDGRQTSRDGVPGASSLSPRMQRIQEQILERRRRGAPAESLSPLAKQGGE